MAIASCINIIANAIAGCEVKTFEKEKEVKKENYFELNIEPNPNQNGSRLWHSAIEKMLNEDEALIVSVANQLHIAESYNCECYPIRGNVYSNVTISGEGGHNLLLNRRFTEKEVIRIKLNDRKIKHIIDNLAMDYQELLNIATKNYKDLNSVKYKLVLDSVKTERENFQEVFNKRVKSQLNNFINNPNGLYIQYRGYELEREVAQSTVNVDDCIKIREEIFQSVAKGFNIPIALVIGDGTRNTNVNQLVYQFLTFCIDPLADMISKELTRKIYPGYDNFSKGNYVLLDTNTILHMDIIEASNGVDKLLADGIMTRNEIRKILNLPKADDEYGDKFFITKNYELMDNLENRIEEQPMVKQIEEEMDNEMDNEMDLKGGEKDEEDN